MKTHPGVLTNTPCKAQTNENDFAEDPGSHSTNKNSRQQDEKQGLAPEKGDSSNPLPVSVGSDVAAETTDTTA